MRVDGENGGINRAGSDMIYLFLHAIYPPLTGTCSGVLLLAPPLGYSLPGWMVPTKRTSQDQGTWYSQASWPATPRQVWCTGLTSTRALVWQKMR